MRQPSATIRLDEARVDLQNRLSRMDCAEKERLIAALGRDLVAKIPQVYDRIPANNFMLSVPLFLDILRSGRVGQIGGLIDGVPGMVPNEGLPSIEFAEDGVLCWLPDGRIARVTEGYIDRQSWNYLFTPPPALSEVGEPRPYVTIADIKEAGWSIDDRSLQRCVTDGLITEEQLRAFRLEAAVIDLRRLRNAEHVPGDSASDVLAVAQAPSGVSDQMINAQIAEWIADQHPKDESKPQSCDKLLRAARASDSPLKNVTDREFRAAYRAVYKTQSGAPPATGWPLNEPYRSKLSKSENKSIT
jgi:hypothetical protein